MTTRRALLLVLFAAAAPSCGSSSSKPKEPPRLTEKQFVSSANRVCIDADRRAFRIGRVTIDPATWAKTSRAARRNLREMRALRSPAAKQGGFDRMLRAAASEVREVDNVHDALVKKNYAKARAAQQRATDDDSAVKRQAKTLGLTFCEQLLTNWPA